ncbi:unnamed protein product, partial [Nezara viridula]
NEYQHSIRSGSPGPSVNPTVRKCADNGPQRYSTILYATAYRTSSWNIHSTKTFICKDTNKSTLPALCSARNGWRCRM